MKKLLLALVVVALASPAFAAEIYVKSTTHADAMSMMGRTVPARDDVSEVWMTPTKMATIGRDSTLIIDLDANMAYMVNHRTKSYVETPLPFDIAKLLPPEAAAMAPMMQMTAVVTPSTETKHIGQWDCTAYDAVLTVMGMKMNLRIWASTQVPFDAAAFQAKLLPAVMQAQMRLSPDSLSQFAKIKGYQIATETTADMMGAKLHTTTEVLEIVQKPAPAGTFAPPAGYAKKSLLSMEELQRR
jgi:hypothetical protein